MEAKHTATPWKIAGASGTAVYGATGNMVAAIYGDDPQCRADERMIANAAFIVRACNAHDDLVKALQGLIRAGHSLNASSHEWNAAHAALAKAGA